MKTFLITFLALFCVMANAAPVQRIVQDIKLPTQAVLEHETITTPIVATTNRIKTTYAGPTSAAAVTLTTFTAQPDVPRVITITPTGTTTDVESCAVVVNGTSITGKAISDTLTFAADASTAQTSVKAFKTVTSIVWPANCESGGFGATWIVGVGSALGVKRCTKNAGSYVFSTFDGAYETTRGTFVSDASTLCKNLFTPNGTMNGAKDVEVYYVQNYGCFE